MKKYLLPVSIALGIAFDLLFWKKAPGISFPLFCLLCLSAGYFLIRLDGKCPEKVNFLLLLPILFFSLLTALRREPLTIFLGFSFSLFAMAMLSFSYLNGLWPAFGFVDYIANFFHLLGGMLTLPWLEKEAPNGTADALEKSKKRKIVPVLRGIALSLPVWLAFVGLLYSADLIFAQRLDAAFRNFNLENLPETFIRFFLILLVGLLFSGAILYAARRSGNTRLTGREKALVSPILGMTETTILMGGVIALFGSFVLVQFRYFFSGQANISLDGFTYAEYARRGFGELVAVAVLSILLQKGLSQIAKRDSSRDRQTFTLLTAGMAGLVLVMLTSAFQRLTLYEAAYGFTRMRTYPHVFMIWLGILLAAMAVMEILRRQRFFINAVLLAAMGFGATLGILNVDRFIARQNLQRTTAGVPLDAPYLANLSSDAVPELVKNFKEKMWPADVREGIGAALVCLRHASALNAADKVPFPSIHFSDMAALRALSQVSKELEGYSINDETWPVVVTSPRGMWYLCQGSGGFD